MSFDLIFWFAFLILAGMIVYCDLKFYLLRDVTQVYKPYSWGRVQLAWWTTIIISSFTSILIKADSMPTFDESTLILLGISAATTATARAIDLSEKTPNVVNPQNQKSNFFTDILSDEFNINIHRFQTVVFNLIFGIYFIRYVLAHFNANDIDKIMPVITTNNLVLLGLSSATYAALKTTENKTKEKEVKSELGITDPLVLEEEPAVG